MKNEKSKMDKARLIVSIILLAVGIFTIKGMGNEFMFFVVLAVGIAFLAYGIISLLVLNSKRKKGETDKKPVMQIIAIIIGALLLIFIRQAAISLFPKIIGIWMIIDAVMLFYARSKIKKFTDKNTKAILICTFVILAAGVLLLFAAFSLFLVNGYSILFAVYGAFSIIAQLLASSAEKKRAIN